MVPRSRGPGVASGRSIRRILIAQAYHSETAAAGSGRFGILNFVAHRIESIDDRLPQFCGRHIVPRGHAAHLGHQIGDTAPFAVNDLTERVDLGFCPRHLCGPEIGPGAGISRRRLILHRHWLDVALCGSGAVGGALGPEFAVAFGFAPFPISFGHVLRRHVKHGYSRYANGSIVGLGPADIHSVLVLEPLYLDFHRQRELEQGAERLIRDMLAVERVAEPFVKPRDEIVQAIEALPVRFPVLVDPLEISLPLVVAPDLAIADARAFLTTFLTIGFGRLLVLHLLMRWRR